MTGRWHRKLRGLRAKDRQTRAEELQYMALNYAPKVFYNTPEWKQLRYRALKEYGATCMLCGASPRTGAVMHVDHIRPRSIYPELALKMDNLQILCEACNLGKSNKDATDWRNGGRKVILRKAG